MSVNFVAVVVAALFEAWWWRLGRSFALGTTVVPVVFVTSERGIIPLSLRSVGAFERNASDVCG